MGLAILLLIGISESLLSWPITKDRTGRIHVHDSGQANCDGQLPCQINRVHEGLSPFGWPVGMSVDDCLSYVNWCGRAQPSVGSAILHAGALNYRSGETELSTNQRTDEHACVHFPLLLTLDVM